MRQGAWGPMASWSLPLVISPSWDARTWKTAITLPNLGPGCLATTSMLSLCWLGLKPRRTIGDFLINCQVFYIKTQTLECWLCCSDVFSPKNPWLSLLQAVLWQSLCKLKLHSSLERKFTALALLLSCCTVSMGAPDSMIGMTKWETSHQKLNRGISWLLLAVLCFLGPDSESIPGLFKWFPLHHLYGWWRLNIVQSLYQRHTWYHQESLSYPTGCML